MLTAQAQVQTPRPGRYLAQFCRHASQMDRGPGHGLRGHGGRDARPEMRQVDWSDTDGSLILSWGQCTLQAAPDLVTARLERFGRRDHLTVAWHRTQSPGAGE